MERAEQGAWLFQIPYTSEPHARTLIYVFYTLLGKVAVNVSGSWMTIELTTTLSELQKLSETFQAQQ